MTTPTDMILAAKTLLGDLQTMPNLPPSVSENANNLRDVVDLIEAMQPKGVPTEAEIRAWRRRMIAAAADDAMAGGIIGKEFGRAIDEAVALMRRAAAVPAELDEVRDQRNEFHAALLAQKLGNPYLDWRDEGNVILDAALSARSRISSAEKERDEARAELARLQTWTGMISVLDKHYPPETFPTMPDTASRDDGARIVSLVRRLDEARSELKAIDDVIADRGVPERDCTLPLPQRVDNIIAELKTWRDE